MTARAPEGGAAEPGTVYVPFDGDDGAFVIEVARAMQCTRLRYGGSVTPWNELHPTTRQHIADVARVAIAMTRVRYSARLAAPGSGDAPGGAGRAGE